MDSLKTQELNEVAKQYTIISRVFCKMEEILRNELFRFKRLVFFGIGDYFGKDSFTSDASLKTDLGPGRPRPGSNEMGTAITAIYPLFYRMRELWRNELNRLKSFLLLEIDHGFEVKFVPALRQPDRMITATLRLNGLKPTMSWALFMALVAFPSGITATGHARPAPGQSEAAQAGAQAKAQASALAASGESGARAGRQSEARGPRLPSPDSPLLTRTRLAQARRSERSLAPVGLRDPFKPPPPPVVASESAELEAELHHPPGPRGLVIRQLRLEGIVREEESHAMIAVVTNTTNLAYFLREHEPVYDGVVTRIASDAVYFQENARDPDRGVKSREVVLRLGPAPGVAR